MYWPTLSMKSWIATLLKSYPELMLGGFKLEQKTEWQELFRYFWRAYKEVDETHPVFHELPIEALSTAIPIMVHGDEGRGLRSQAFMVQSFQFVISHLGPYVTNTSGQLICIWSSFDVDIGQISVHIFLKHGYGTIKALVHQSIAVYVYFLEAIWWGEHTSWSEHSMGKTNGRTLLHRDWGLGSSKNIACSLKFYKASIVSLTPPSHCGQSPLQRKMVAPSAWSGSPQKAIGHF